MYSMKAQMIATALAAVTLIPAVAAAQQAPTARPAVRADDYKQYLPDPSHIPFYLPENIPWEGTAGREQQYKVWGDPAKPGPYLLLLKWWPNNFSRPHFHPNARFVVVVSGTWWASSSNTFDPAKTYPLPPGSVATDVVNTVHWDGAKDEPVVLAIAGDGPSPNVNVDEQGKPLPPRPRTGAGAPAAGAPQAR